MLSILDIRLEETEKFPDDVIRFGAKTQQDKPS